MELRQLEPPDYDVHTTGIYIVDDDGVRVFAGPFDSETAAIGWIVQRQQDMNRRTNQVCTNRSRCADTTVLNQR